MKFTLSPLYAAVLSASLAPLAAQAVELPVRADSYYSLEVGETNKNYGKNTSLIANSSSRKALIKFKGLSQFLPSSATTAANIDRAILHIYVSKITDFTAQFVVSRLDQDWIEPGVTGDTAPTVASFPATYTEPVVISGPALWYNLDITDIVKYWIDHPAEPRGILLQTTVGEVEIDSKENTGTSHIAHVDISLKGNNNGTVTNVSGTAPLSVANGTTTPAISIAQASNATDGYLSSNDWNVFNNKGDGTVTNVTGSGPLSVATGTTTPVLSISQAGAGSDGYLSSTDWNTFNGKGSVSNVTGSGPLSVATGTTTPVLSISQAGAGSDGYLSSTDWNTFNGKGDGTVTNVTGSGPLSVATGTTTPVLSISQAGAGSDGYLSSTDWNTFNGKGNGTVTNVTGSGPLSVATGTTTPVLSITQANSSTDGYLSAADWVLFNSKLSANGDGSSLTGITGSQISGNIAGNAGTATNLAANGSDCTAGNYPLGVDAAGNAESCTPAATGTITGVTAGTGLTGGGTSGNVTLSLGNTSVAPGTYTNSNITVDAQGRIISASTGAPGNSGTVTSVTGSSPISVSNPTTTPSISLGTVGIANGGTNATNAASARFNLGLGNVATLSTPGNTTTFLRGDGTFAAPASGGPTVYNNDTSSNWPGTPKILTGTIANIVNSSTATATFGSAFSSTPVCTAIATSDNSINLVITATSTTSVTIKNRNLTFSSPANFICVGS